MKKLILILCVIPAILLLSVFAISGTNEKTIVAAAEGTAGPFTSCAETLDTAGNDANIGIAPMGWWEDLWKIPEEIDAYGTVHAGNKDTVVDSGSYTNKSYGYTAPDGFPQFQYSLDNKNWDVTVLGTHTMFSNTNADGWRYYRGYKPSPKGDYSKVSSICLDTVKPQLQVKLNGSSIGGGTVTTLSGSYFSVFATDDVSGVASYWYKVGSGTYTECSAYTYFYGDGVYSFYAKDTAGNVSDTITVTRDTTAPTVRAYSGSTSTQLSNGTYASVSSVRFDASDSTTGVYGIYVRTPGASGYSFYSSTSVTFTSEGLYYYYARDNAGNYSSTYTVTVDRTIPAATLYSGTSSVSSGYYSAASYIKFTASDTNGCYLYMKKDSGSYNAYTSGTQQTAEGVYYFYAYDPAGNITSTYTITLDRTAPTGTLYAGTSSVSSGKITNASYVKYTATDNLALNTLYVRTPGSSSYVSFTSGTQYTADGTYYFYSTDKSGNASSTVSIVLDRTKPTAAITAGTSSIQSGGFTNNSTVSFSASDATSGVSAMYVKLPNTGSYIAYVAGTPFSTEGIYYFYATDVAGNTGDTVNVTLDKTVPTGTLTANGATVTSGTFTNKAFYYTASDSLSGVSKCEIKRPNGAWETYTSGTTIAATSANGLYFFRATDKAGNISQESQINLVTAAPAITLYAGSSVVASGTNTNSGYVAFTATGVFGATASLYVKMPGSSAYTAYTSGTQLTKEGLYSFYAADNAGNTSATVTITLDSSKPIGFLTAGGVTVSSGDYINSAFKYSATDSVSGIAKLEILRPNGAWQTYGGEEITVGSGNGWYSFRATDKAGNVSAESKVYFLTSAPSVQLYIDEQPASNGTYTNLARVSMSASGGAALTCYVKLPNASGFTVYNQYFPYTAAGRYEFYAEDAAGNQSGVFWVVIDRTAKLVTQNGVSGGNAAGNVSLTWTDGGNASAPIVSVTVNGKAYVKGNTIKTIDGGVYSIKSTDAAGNVWTAAFTAARTEILSETLNKSYYETKDGAGNSYAFESYANALNFASEREAALVRTGVWNGAVWDGGIPVDSTDSANAKNGTYYIYKKSGDKNTEVAYFTLERLNTVITEYAAESVKAYYWWEKVPSAPASAENLYTLKYDKVFIGDSVNLASHANYLIDGAPLAGLTYSIEGNHILTVYDDYGNSYEYVLKISRQAPKINYMVEGGGVFNTATNDRQYQFTKAVTVKITDGVDDFAMFYIKNSAGETVAILSLGDEYVISKSGRYTIQAVNHGGISEETVFTLSLSRPAATFTDNGTAKRLEIRIQASYDTTAALTDIKIYRSRDNGLTWVLLTADDYGNAVSVNKLFYEFNRDGIYKVVIEDNFRSGIDAVIAETVYYKPAPAGNLYGVKDGGYTNSAVRFVWADEAFAFLTRNGETASYISGTEITEQGEYVLEFCDENGYSRVYTFTIDTAKPTGTVTANDQDVQDGAYINKAFKFTATDNLSGTAYYEIRKQGGAWTAYNGEEIAANSGDGWYVFRAFDRAGNVSGEIRVYLITSAPETTIYAGGIIDTPETILSGANTNKNCITFTANSVAGVIMYVKTPDGSGYAIYNGASLYGEGTYYFYAVDGAGNVSKTVSVTLDTAVPAGTVTANGAIIEDGKYINKAFSYAAADGTSGIDRYEIKKPDGVWESYNGAEIAASSGDGWYMFRAFDRAGNVSVEIRIYLITAAPETAIYAAGETILSGSYTNKSYITFTANSGAGAIMYVKTPDGGGYAVYEGAQIYGEGTYYFYAVDGAGNVSKAVSITLDKSSPVGVIATDSVSGYTNKAFSYSATDNISGVARYEIKCPDGVWENYYGAEIAAGSGNGWYAFRAYDQAGNLSAESRIYLLTDRPIVQLYADENPVYSGTYTNAARISMSADGGAPVTCYVKQPGGGFVLYNQYYTFSAAGRYEFYAIDQAGNQSDIFVIIIDRTAKAVTLNGVSGGKTNGDVTLTWTDGDGKTAAAIVAVTVNGKAYVKGGVIKTIDGGAYRVESIDAAGNVWTATFTAARTEILSETLNKQYFETQDSSGKTYAFDSYGNAIAYATARETALVRTAAWSGAAWDGGIPMDTADSVNAQNGTYYIYKKSGDKSTEVAYFTLERLNAVIAQYAAASVKAYYWWEKSPVESYNGNSLYSLIAGKVFIGDSVTLAGHANYLIDGVPYFGLTYSAEGEHTLTVFDDYGNSYNYTLIIVRTAPDVLYSLGGGVWNKAAADRQYAFNSTVTIGIGDVFDGGFAMYLIRNSAGEVIAVIGCGEEYTLTQSGRYTVSAVNHGGWSADIQFILSLSSPAIGIKDNAGSKRLEVRIEPSMDSGVTLTDIRIYMSTDGGVTWTLLGKDDYGRTINANGLFYEFNKDGLYKVVVEDNFRSGIDAVVVSKDYLKPAPEGALIGADNGGYTNGTVKFTWTDEATARLTCGGKIADYISGTEITEEGVYVLEFKDSNGYSKVYTFTIDKTAPQGTLNGAEKDGLTNKTVTLTFTDNGADGALYKDGELIGAYESGAEISADGAYKITLADRAGNITEYTFAIDTFKPEATLSGVENGGKTSSAVMLKGLTKQAEIKAYYNGGLFEYTPGTSLTNEGSYRFILTDEAGNTAEYTFEIVFAYNAGSVIFIVIFIILIIGAAVLIILMRKKKLFKSKKK